jgi:hypothetical protein
MGNNEKVRTVVRVLHHWMNMEDAKVAAKQVCAALATPPESAQVPAYCDIHQHYKWCEHNGGVLGSTGYEAPTVASPEPPAAATPNSVETGSKVVDAKPAAQEGVFSPWNACCYREQCRENARRLAQPVGEVDEAAVIACELARIDGYDPEDKQGGLYDLRWSSGSAPEPLGDAWSMDYLPKAEKISAALTAARIPAGAGGVDAAFRRAYSSIIRSLAELATAPQTDEQCEKDLIPRDYVMDRTASIRRACDDLSRALRTGGSEEAGNG